MDGDGDVAGIPDLGEQVGPPTPEGGAFKGELFQPEGVAGRCAIHAACLPRGTLEKWGKTRTTGGPKAN